MNKTTKDLLFISLVVIVVTLSVWLPHFLALPKFWGLNFSNGFATIYRNFDGLEYVVIAKSFYNPEVISDIPLSLSPIYYASHFPGYALSIALFAPVLGYLKSMLFVSGLFTIASVVAFYFLVHNLKLSSHPLLLSLIFLILPARWLIVHSVGSSEPLFIFLIITALYFFIRFETTGHFQDIILAGVAGLLAQITRPPGVLLFISLSLFLFWKIVREKMQFTSIIRIIGKNMPLLLMPLALLSIFSWYSITYQDFFAYFHSGDNIHLTFPPFQVFNKDQFWVGDIWLEDIIYIFILGFLGGVILWKRKLHALAFFVLTYLAAATLVVHRDISRYLLPVAPFILIAFEKVLTSREFKIILPIIALAIYLYAQNFILENIAPIPNLSAFN